LRLPLLVLGEHQAQQVGIERATKALVGGDHDDADPLHRVAIDQERMAVLRVGVRDVRRYVADLLPVGTGVAHALLRLPHLRGGDHFHRLGDLSRVLHATDLHPDFLGSGH
jgi:hypothetical protein